MDYSKEEDFYQLGEKGCSLEVPPMSLSERLRRDSEAFEIITGYKPTEGDIKDGKVVMPQVEHVNIDNFSL